MRIALAQLDAAPGDIEGNLDRARSALGAAAAQRADLVVFPELSLSGYCPGVQDKCVLDAADRRLPAVAPAGGPSAVIGFCERAADGDRNSVAYVQDGQLVHVQRKVALVAYPPFDEHRRFVPGDSVRAFDTRHGRMAMLVCNDAWQPGLADIAARDRAEIMIVAINSADSRLPALSDLRRSWAGIGRTYATLFQCFVVLANRVGTAQDGTRFWGGSSVVGPDGEVRARAPLYAESLVVAELDLAEVHRRRRDLLLLDRAAGAVAQAELTRLAAAPR